MRSTGSVVGGAINFSTNYSRSIGGGIAWATYLIFLGFGMAIPTCLVKCKLTSARM
jgi:predicted outer membrane repeat protein